MNLAEKINQILKPYGDYQKMMHWTGSSSEYEYLRDQLPKIVQALLEVVSENMAEKAELEAKVKAYEAIILNSNFKAGVTRKANEK